MSEPSKPFRSVCIFYGGAETEWSLSLLSNLLEIIPPQTTCGQTDIVPKSRSVFNLLWGQVLLRCLYV